MYYLELPSNCPLDVPLNLYLGFEPMLDFCVWVLTIDGLQVEPFVQHEDGNHCLRQRGLTVEQWQDWVARIVAYDDPCLFWESNDETQQDFFRDTTPELSAVDAAEVAFDDRFARYVREQFVRSRSALPSDINLDSDISPISLWNGSAEIGEALVSLWQQYRALNDRENGAVQRALNYEFHPLLEQLQSLRSQLPILTVYLVRYPALLTYACPPVAALISIPDRLDSEQYGAAVEQLAHQLAAV